MKIRVFLSMLVASITVALIFFAVPDLSIIPDYYAKNIRGSLFAGFLTVGSFLLSLKAFIVVKLKENVFDTQVYKDKLTELRKINPELTLYGPVKRLSKLLFVTISSAIAASISQLTIGLLDCWIAVLLCAFLAVFAMAMLVATLLLIRRTLDEWLEYLEEAHNSATANKN